MTYQTPSYKIANRIYAIFHFHGYSPTWWATYNTRGVLITYVSVNLKEKRNGSI